MWVPSKRRTLCKLVCLQTFLVFFVLQTLNKISSRPPQMSRTFAIDYIRDTFLKDGQPFRFVSGSFHYFRTPRSKWRRVMRAMRAAGLNALSTYIEWSSHETSPGRYRYDGDLDFEHFLRLAAGEDLYVLLRPGPFICGERDFGGLPSWIWEVSPQVVLRRNHPEYQRHVTTWFKQLFTKLEKYLYGNGGPIILVQVENEYGSDETCDPEHAVWLRDLLVSYVQDKAVLYSTDGAYEDYLVCSVLGVYPTVDFTAFQNVSASFQAQRIVAPRGPLVNSEFYTGWLTHWQNPFVEVVSTEDVILSLSQMLALDANVNLYMFYGGTNFGFKSGANFDEKGGYQACLTSYDYDSPLNEAGDPTEKYFAIRNVMSNYVQLPDVPVPEALPKGDYGDVVVKPKVSIFDLTSKVDSVFAQKPLSFESLSQSHGFVLYETTIPSIDCSTCLLVISKFHDITYIFIDEVFVSQMYRSKQTNVSFVVETNQKLSLFVENFGRINHGNVYDFKGILSDVTLEGKALNDWVMYKFPLGDVSFIENATSNAAYKLPMFFSGDFQISSQPLDTFLDIRNWSKGVVFVNEYNVGRYWSEQGPQYTLFVPSDFLKSGSNRITIFELKSAPQAVIVRFVTEPIFNYENQTEPQ